MEQQRRRRRRPALSCIECRRRKIKCDRSDPCRHCVSTDTCCTFKLFNHDGTSHSGSSPARSLASVGHGPASAERVDASVIRDADTPSDRKQHSDKSLQDLSDRVQRLEKGLVYNPQQSPTETWQSILAEQFGLEKSQTLLNKTRMLRASHWMKSAKEFKDVYACYDAVLGENSHNEAYKNEEVKTWVTEIGTLMKKCKIISKNLKVEKPTRSLISLQSELAPPLGDTADDMVKLYLECFEPTTRIVHTGTFWEDYLKYKTDAEGARMDLRLKVLLVVGLGSSLGKPAPAFRSTVQHWVYAAQRWLTGPLEKDRLSISGIQVYCLTILARQVFTVGGDLVWTSMGHLMHMAMQMGLHRDPKHLPPMTVLQAELRRRLWASILEMTLQASLDAAMPPRISVDEFDTEPPANIDDDVLTDATESCLSKDRKVYTSTSIQLALLDSMPTRLKILRLLTGLHSEISYGDVLSLSAELRSHLREIGLLMSKNESRGSVAFHRNMVDYLVRRFMIPLHCSFACKARTNPLYQSSMKVCLDTALSLMAPHSDEGFSRVVAMGGGLFREGLRFACSVIGLEILAETTAQKHEGALHENSAYRKMLKASLKEFVELGAERIRQGENNIKLHMFLSMILAQVEAMEAGMEVEPSIARKGRDSLVLCHELLQERASNSQISFEDLDISPDLVDWPFDSNFDWNTGLYLGSTINFF